MSEWHLYLIRTRRGALYTGITTDVVRRFAEHQAGGPKCAKYLRGRGPLELVFYQKIGTRGEALQAEMMVKKLPKTAKEALVAGQRGL
jgi:putative endonuclease